MSVLAIVENSNGKLPKSAFEAVYYGSQIGDVTALSIGDVSDDDLAGLGGYGAKKVLSVKDDKLKNFDSQAYTEVIAKAAEAAGADVLVFSHGFLSKSVAPRLSVRLKAGIIISAMELPKDEGGKLLIKRTAYAGKAFAYCTIDSDKKIITVQPNAFAPESSGNSAPVEAFSTELGDDLFKVNIKEVNQVTDKVSLSDASVVVSGGRGLKGPENWGMIEELANLLGAATACSKPVADADWRPHAEHVGQTGMTVRPNLYIAIGISGAIQHLAGVNGSKVLVVINKDPEAPFFKAADYGIVGDAFKVVPKLVEAARKLKAS